MSEKGAGNDHIDRLLAKIAEAGVADIDLDVEGIVDRIGSIHRRMKKAQEATLREYGLTHAEWGVLTSLRLGSDHCESSPGELASDLELSSGAMTSRLDRLEQAGLVRRLPDPDDRRSIVVQLTDEGREAWDTAANIQGRREAFIASVLTKDEQRQLNVLLRKLLLGFEPTGPKVRSRTQSSASAEPASSKSASSRSA
ncbi:MAG: MarR family winged helix-turn-helix transcriptional regulator [Gaiellaceae bacterium]